MTIDWSAVAAANTFGAGPTSGGDDVPVMRKIVYADLDASVRAALLADILCNIGQNFPQWLNFALNPFKAGSASVLTTGTWVDRPPAFEFVAGVIPRASRISGTGALTIDVKFGSTGGAGGSSIFSTKLTIDNNELSSTTAAVPCVLNTSIHTDDAEMAIVIEAAGTDTVGLVVKFPVFWTEF